MLRSFSVCRGCPEPYQPAKSEHESNGEMVPIMALNAGNSVIWHSHCGDRVQWVAAHELTLRKGLRPT